MYISKPVMAAAIAVSAAACGQGDSQNVMVPAATPLTQAQVERALGPEPQTDSSEPNATNENVSDVVATNNQTEGEQQ